MPFATGHALQNTSGQGRRCAAHVAHGVDANLLRTRAMRDVAQLKQTSQNARLVLALLRRRPD